MIALTPFGFLVCQIMLIIETYLLLVVDQFYLVSQVIDEMVQDQYYNDIPG